MNNSHLVEQFMEENGIELDKVITVYGDDELQGEYMFKRDINGRLYLIKDDKRCNLSTLAQLIFGYKTRIQKEPFKPEEGQKYYYVNCKNRDVLADYYYEKEYFNKVNFLIGNCFRTELEAKVNEDKISKILRRDEPLIYLNEEL